jgi:glycosyltransferase involved in cell wall biosynthesis
MDRPLLSVIIITKNEQDNIKNCLESVKWADEIIVVDSGSTDRTEEICRKYTDKFYVKDWPGFGIQKQRALDLASHDWALSIDADERIMPELRDEIISKITQNSNISGYLIPRLSNYLGKDIRHSGWYPDYILRLVKKQEAYFTKDIVHEKMVVKGSIKKLSNHFLHYPYKDITHHMKKLNDYSSLSAEKMFSNGKRISWPMIFLKALYGFIRAYILRRGFLDGWQGVVVSISTTISVYYKYLKLKELEVCDIKKSVSKKISS